jgi:TolA-binding protein
MKWNNCKIAAQIIQMIRYSAILLFAGLILTSCSPSAPKKAAEIANLENEIRESAKKNISDTAKVKILLSDYMSYANTFPTDSMTPAYLMKSAKFYDFIFLTDSAIHCYDRVYTSFPGYPKSNLALFSEAFLYANEKHDLAKAELLYKEYIAKYPNTSLAKSAALELRTLGKTPDQIMAEMDSLKQIGKDSTTSAK